MSYPKIVLKSGKDRPIRNGHPWVFSGAIKNASGAKDGEFVQVTSNKGDTLGIGYYNSASQIAVRLLTRDAQAIVSADFIRGRVAAAIDRRRALLGSETNGFRLIHAEADGLPGIIVDAFDDVVVLQSHTLGSDGIRGFVADALEELLAPSCIYERSDLDVRRHEGLQARPPEPMRGKPPEEPVVIVENGLKFEAFPISGQKTGFFIDQRNNRELVRRLANGRAVLNVYSYTGAGSVFAIAGGAVAVESVDSDAGAIAAIDRNLALNDLNADIHTAHGEDARAFLKRNVKEGRRFDVVVLDPPAFAKHRGALKNALWAYREINGLALQLLQPGGFLLTCSCSGLVSRDAFRTALSQAASDAKAPIILLGDYPQPPDHPTLPAFSEGEYLKSVLVQRIE